MKLRIVLLLILSVLLFARAQPNHTQAPIVFTHATIIDVTEQAPKRDMTVVITGDRISAIGDNIPMPAGAQVVDATGKFLIPGLWDMHVHWYFRDTFTLFIANGVTGVRQMFATPISCGGASKSPKARCSALAWLSPVRSSMDRSPSGPIRSQWATKTKVAKPSEELSSGAQIL